MKKLAVTLLVFGGVCVPLLAKGQGETGRGPVISKPLMASEPSSSEQSVSSVVVPKVVPARGVESHARGSEREGGYPELASSSSQTARQTTTRAGEIAKAFPRGEDADMTNLPRVAVVRRESMPGAAASKWEVLQGASLQDGVRRWTDVMGYELVWDAPYDFPIRASLAFDGDFVEAVGKLFDAYRDAGRPLQVDVYKEQRLMRVFPQDEVAYE